MGKLITFEGVDGSGKTSLVNETAKKLKAHGYSVIVMQEPGTTDMGQEIRKLLKSDLERSKMSEILLFQASRSDMVERVLKPALDKYDYVLLDRYIDSTLAYQGYGNGADIQLLNQLNDLAVNGCYPDIIILVDVPLEIALSRGRKRGDADKFDKDLEFATKVYNGYQDLLQKTERMVAVPNDYLDLAVEDVFGILTNA